MATTGTETTGPGPAYGSDGGGERADSSGNVNEDGMEEENRESWSGRITFWLAAVGSAVGLGNLWRFPYQCAKWGGGAFIFAYFIALFTLGMPLLTQELVLGQKHRSGDIEAFGRMNWRLRGIGLASVIGGFGIVTYYMMIIGVSMVFFFESFMVPLPYDGEGGDTYWLSVLGLIDDPDGSAGVMSGKLYLGTTLCWVLTFLCIMKGVSSASWAVKITMPLPLLLLFILLIKGLTLEGAWSGIKQYFDFSNWDELGQTGIWNAAIGQCFFSLSVCMGVMTAYGSYNPIRQDIATDEKVIAFLDVGVSLMSGFVVYSILGFLVTTTGNECLLESGGPGLVFAVFPTAIATFAGANFFGIIFYLTLVLLGIDSAFSIVEAISTVIADSDLNVYRLKWSRAKISGVLCLVGAFGSSLYCFDTGFYWLDVVDHYINNYGMIFLGICETGACGWFYRYDVIEDKIGKVSASLYRLGYWISLIMACLLSFTLASPVHTLIIPAEGSCDEDTYWTYLFTGTMGNDSWIVGFVVGITLWIVTILIAFFQRSDYAKQNLSIGETLWYIMGWENVEVLRDFMNGNGLGEQAWANTRHTLKGEARAGVHHSTIGIWWGFLIKYWLPTVLTINLVGTMRENRWNPYGGYSPGYIAVGVLIFVAMVFIVILIAIFPQWMTQSVDDSNKFGNVGAVAVADKSENALSPVSDGDGYTDVVVKKEEEVELVSEEKPDKAKENQADVVEEEEMKPEEPANNDDKDEPKKEDEELPEYEEPKKEEEEAPKKEEEAPKDEATDDYHD